MIQPFSTPVLAPPASFSHLTKNYPPRLLQKDGLWSEGVVDISVVKPTAAAIEEVHVKGADANLFTARQVQNGSWAIGFTRDASDTKIAKAAKTRTIKLNVYLAGSNKPVVVKLKVVVR